MPSVVTIDGTEYLPRDQPRARIGVALSTRDRRDVYTHTLAQWRQFLPTGATLVVVDDASATPAPDATVRFSAQQGIARSKNAGIEALMAAGCSEIFLADDDCYPTQPGWERLYVDNPEPHLMYLFKDPGPRGPQPTPATLYDDGTTYAYAHPRGCLLYLSAPVIERVGGMRPQFGIWGHEHVEYSLRIHHAGLTTAPFADACGSASFIHSMDEHAREHEGFKRAVPQGQRVAELNRNEELLDSYRGTTDYVDYRALPNVCLTTLLTKVVDPQRKKRLTADPDVLGKWRASLADCNPVVLVDELDSSDPAYVRVPTCAALSPYLQRWVSAWQYLRDHPCVNVFITDGTDVEMLHTPWPHLTPGRLVVGHETTIVGIPWMRDNHAPYREWIEANADRQLVNAGVVGGDYATVLAFCHDMVSEIFTRGNVALASDMATFNYVVHQRWSDRAVWGSRWVTVFKANEQNNEVSCFRHK